MNGQQENVHTSTEKVAAGASITEGLVGLGAVALAIIGLAHILPVLLASISTIARGAAFVFEAGTVGARFSALTPDFRGTTSSRSWSSWGTMTAGFLAGCAGIALGILALLGIDPMVLIPIAAIVFGAALVMDSGVRVRLSALECENAGYRGMSQDVAREAASASAGIQVMVGLGGITLGILAIIGISPLTLSLVALLGVGCAVLVAGSLISSKMLGVYGR